jgi:hypothetical protein
LAVDEAFLAAMPVGVADAALAAVAGVAVFLAVSQAVRASAAVNNAVSVSFFMG